MSSALNKSSENMNVNYSDTNNDNSISIITDTTTATTPSSSRSNSNNSSNHNDFNKTPNNFNNTASSNGLSAIQVVTPPCSKSPMDSVSGVQSAPVISTTIDSNNTSPSPSKKHNLLYRIFHPNLSTTSADSSPGYNSSTIENSKSLPRPPIIRRSSSAKYSSSSISGGGGASSSSSSNTPLSSRKNSFSSSSNGGDLLLSRKSSLLSLDGNSNSISRRNSQNSNFNSYNSSTSSLPHISINSTHFHEECFDGENDPHNNNTKHHQKITAASIFKDLLRSHSGSNSGRGRKTSNASSIGSNSQGVIDNPTQLSSDDDAASHHPNEHNLFKGLVRGRKYKKAHPSSNLSSPAVSPPVSSANLDAYPVPGALSSANNTSQEIPRRNSIRNISPPPPQPSDTIATSSTPNLISPKMSRSASESSLVEKYGKRSKGIIGRGGQAVIRLCCSKTQRDKNYAVKEFRKRRKDETQREYLKKLVAEFCIFSSLDNAHVVKCFDLIQDEKSHWCVVMEYCSGGDLFTRISENTLKDPKETNCYFKQLIIGVKYLHSMGVAHRDLKPENLLLDSTHQCIKITDFGVSEVFRTPFASASHKCCGKAGSGPYIAPEEHIKNEYDSEKVDVWASGLIFYVMSLNSFPWSTAQLKDTRYKYYLEHYLQFYPIQKSDLDQGCKDLLYQMLNSDPNSRVSVDDIIDGNEWFKGINVCIDQNGCPITGNDHSNATADHHHHHHQPYVKKSFSSHGKAVVG